MKRCCEGDTFVQDNGYDPKTREKSWAVVCVDCGRVLAVVDGPREEVYSDL